MLLTNTLTIHHATRYRPLTAKMKESLMDIHERELLKLEPYDAGLVKFSKGLIERGLLKCEFYNTAKGKKIMALYITETGRRYLDQLTAI